jgi:hypothetical protein
LEGVEVPGVVRLGGIITITITRVLLVFKQPPFLPPYYASVFFQKRSCSATSSKW